MMLPRSNVHTHTCFSDASNTVEEMVQAALARGFTSLGFSDHGAASYDSAAMHDEPGYRAEVLRVKEKYAGLLEIALGYEHDSFAADADLSPYEYIIESVHYLHKDGVYIPIDLSASMLQHGVDLLYGGDALAMAKDYFANVNRSMTDVQADIVGHIGLITKFSETSPLFDSADPRYLAYARETVSLAAERGILVEVNTGAMSRGYRTAPYPDLALLKLLKEKGGRITITSDCHRAEWIDFGFDQAIGMAKAAGFEEAWVWEQGRFVPKAL